MDPPKPDHVNKYPVEQINGNGEIKFEWDIPNAKQRIPPTAVIALALAEAGRSLQFGKIGWVDSGTVYDEKHPQVPEIFYFPEEWEKKKIRKWDGANYAKRLKMIQRVKNRTPDGFQRNALPVRFITSFKSEDCIRFALESKRLSSVVLMYDGQLSLDWYSAFARRRNGERDCMCIEKVKHQDWLDVARAGNTIAVMEDLHAMWYETIFQVQQPVVGSHPFHSHQRRSLQPMRDVRKRVKEALRCPLVFPFEKPREVKVQHLGSSNNFSPMVGVDSSNMPPKINLNALLLSILNRNAGEPRKRRKLYWVRRQSPLVSFTNIEESDLKNSPKLPQSTDLIAAGLELEERDEESFNWGQLSEAATFIRSLGGTV